MVVVVGMIGDGNSRKCFDGDTFPARDPRRAFHHERVMLTDL